MKRLLGGVCLVLSGSSVAAGLVGLVDVVTGCVLAVPIALAGVVLLIVGGLSASLDRDAKRVRELPTRGVARQGVVVDALPYASAHGGAVFQAEGAQMVLRVELPGEHGGKSQVSIHVVEPSESSRARIGSSVTILEHPDDPALRALSGFLPNGRRSP